MYDKNKLDRLLNDYMDDCLSERRKTEVKRLLQHDSRIAARLTELQKIRSLLAVIPVAEAPPDFVENVKQKIEQRSFTRRGTDYFDRGEGARQLLWRRSLSVAAIATLVVALAAVVYIIVRHQPSEQEHFVSKSWIEEEIPLPDSITKKAVPQTDSPPTPQTAAAADVLPERFTGRLELNTEFFTGVDAFIKRTLVDNGITLIELPVAQSEKGVYNLSCNRNAAELFIADLATIWDRFDSAILRVDTGRPGRDIIINNVTAKQINEIIAQADLTDSIRLAKDTAAINSVTRNLPGNILAAATEVNSLTIPKPVLTSPNTVPKKTETGDEKEMIELVIQINNIR